MTTIKAPRAVKRVFEVEGKRVEVKGQSAFDLLGFAPHEATALLGDVVAKVIQRRNGIKHELVDRLQEIAQAQELTITEMAKEVAITRPRLSSIMNHDFDKISIDAVVDVLHRLGKEVRIQVVDREHAV